MLSKAVWCLPECLSSSLVGVENSGSDFSDLNCKNKFPVLTESRWVNGKFFNNFIFSLL